MQFNAMTKSVVRRVGLRDRALGRMASIFSLGTLIFTLVNSAFAQDRLGEPAQVAQPGRRETTRGGCGG